MTEGEARRQAVRFWLEKAAKALEAAETELREGRHDFAVNRAYYACFYAASAVLLERGKKFKKHAGVRSALHEHLVKTGLVSPHVGEFYDRLFAQRMQADYVEFAQFDESGVRAVVDQANEFVAAMQRLPGPQME